MTARRVAAQRLSFTRVDSAYGQPDADQRLQADVASGVDVSTTPLKPYLQARTTFFDRVIVDSIASGIDQVVVVGAGYDGRSLRYAKPGVRWFELDHPDTQADKRERLERLDIHAPDVIFAPVNFVTDDVVEALRNAGHDATKPTLFSCEGVAGYLPTDVTASLINTLAGCAAAGSTLAMSLSLEPVTHSGRERRSRLSSAVASVGEPLVSAVPRARLRDMFAANKWVIDQATDPAGVDVATSESNAAFVVARRPAGR